MTDPEHIYHWRRVDARLTTSGQPEEADLDALRALGVSRIINLGLHDHPRALADERASVTARGMTYDHIPVAFDAPTEGHFLSFCDAMARAADETLHVHCIANMRVTAFLYRYWRHVKGVEESAARALMDSVWRPGGVWAEFIGDDASKDLPHRAPEGR